MEKPAQYLTKEQPSKTWEQYLFCYVWPSVAVTNEKADIVRKTSLWLGTVGTNYSPNQKKQGGKKGSAKCVHKNHQSFGGVPESCGLQMQAVLSIKHVSTEGGTAKWPKAARAALENNSLVIMDTSGNK